MTVDVAALFLREARRGVPRPHENGTGAQGRSRGLSLMRLADFIDGYAEDILIEWEQFAATKLPAAAGMRNRALRASLLRFWSNSGNPEDQEAVKDIIRFGEAIDQAIAESVDHFSAEIDRARNLFLGILGHELRNPLNAIQVTAQHLARSRSDEMVSKAAQRLIDSGGRMQALLDDLLDYSRTTLAVGIKVEPVPVDFAELSRKVCDELGSAHPHRTLELQMTGDLCGSWDPGRIQQVLSNLLQ